MSEFLSDITNLLRKYDDITVDACLADAVSRNAAAPFLLFENSRFTRGSVGRMADKLSVAISRHDSHSSNIAIMLPNTPVHVAMIFATALSRKCWVPIHMGSRGLPLERLLSGSKPDLLVVADDNAEHAEAAAEAAGLVCPIVLVDTEVDADRVANSIEAAAQDADITEDRQPNAPNDVFCICYTSGTSGPPKGALLSHRNMLRAGLSSKLVSGFEGPGRMLHWEPLSHLSGSQLLFLSLLEDCELVLLKKFSANRFLHDVAEHRVQHIHYLGGVMQILNSRPPSEIDTSHGATIAWGAGCPLSSWQEISDRFGVQLRECYGLTETAGFASANFGGPAGSVGKVLPWLEIKILDDQGQSCLPGVTGEIFIRSDDPGGLASGYFNAAEAASSSFRDGGFYSSDLGWMDKAGNLYFSGRKSDSLRHKGENVSAWEVEAAVKMHDSIRDCAVIGVETDIGEQDIKIFIELTPGCEIDLNDIRSYCLRNLAKHQVPRYYKIVDAFDRTPSHRIKKDGLSKLKDDAWDSWNESTSNSG